MQPIILDCDGRNRFAACELVPVEPEFSTYDGDDPDGYALAVNVIRKPIEVRAEPLLIVAITQTIGCLG